LFQERPTAQGGQTGHHRSYDIQIVETPVLQVRSLVAAPDGDALKGAA